MGPRIDDVYIHVGPTWPVKPKYATGPSHRPRTTAAEQTAQVRLPRYSVPRRTPYRIGVGCKPAVLVGHESIPGVNVAIARVTKIVFSAETQWSQRSRYSGG